MFAIMTHAMLPLLLLGFVINSIQAEEPILTLKQRMDIFGTNRSDELPPIEYVTIQRSRRREPNTAQYRLTLEGEDVVLTLKQNAHLLTPGCVVHHHQSDGYKTLYPCARDTSKCYYTGKSEKHPGSWAAVNTCQGLKGMIGIRNTTHVIAPLNEKRTGFFDDDDPGDVHVVYRYVGDKMICKTQALLDDIKIQMEGRTRRAMTGGATRCIEADGTTDPSALLDDIKAQTSGRSRRATLGGATRYIEAGVVIDPSVFDFFGHKAEEYVQTTFNVASKLYEDDSLGTKMNLCLSEIHIYESYNSFAVPFTMDADKTLTDFCAWHAKATTSSPDCTVLYTRLNLEYRGNPSTVGLAKESSMCHRGQNCAIVQDVGPASGVTIAHEIGHLLGMSHDNNDATCGDIPGTMDPGVMEPGATGPAAYRWSTCSARSLYNFLSTPSARCLSTTPPHSAMMVGFNHSAPLPGTLYSKDEQCKLLHGNQWSYCYDLKAYFIEDQDLVCKHLICRENSTAKCTAMSQVLDGSDCNNTRSWCMSSKCVVMDATSSTPPIDGAWSAWDESYSPCSRSCGGGVKIKRRTCTDPRPRYGGQLCSGDSVQAVMCNMQACSSSYKELQCSAYNSVWGTKYGLWHHDTQARDLDTCMVKCISSLGYTHSRHSKDGTECESSRQGVQYGRCVDNICKGFGCDGLLDSGLTTDQCGFCNGTGANCRRVHGRYNSKQGDRYNYTRVVVIPRGSYGVIVKQRSQYFLLSVSVNGQRVVNQDAFRPSRSGAYKAQGVDIQYQKFPESIKIAGPTPVDVEIQVFRTYDLTPDIDYEYYVRRTSLTSSYTWSKRWAPCTKTCGTGYELPIVQCEDLSRKRVADGLCDLEQKPREVRRPCNDHLCPPVWETTDLGSCSVTCGPGGTRQRKVHCVRENNGQQVILQYGCDALQRPPSTVNCTLVPCPMVWKAGNWSKCSKSCGEGIQSRSVTCSNPDTGLPTEDRLCTRQTRPSDEQLCTHGFCPGLPFGPECRNLKGVSCKKTYGADICYRNPKYIPWAEAHCMLDCGMCSPDDDPRCRLMADRGNNPCAGNSRYHQWALHSCRKLCRECVDGPQCQGLVDGGTDVCTHTAFAKQHCPAMCGFCGPCEDDPGTPCMFFSFSTCSRASVRASCKKHCGVCQ